MKRVLLVLLGLVVTLLLAEGGLRLLPPSSRVQIVRLDGEGQHLKNIRLDGVVPLWDSAADPVRRNAACLDATHDERWLILGSSIFAANALTSEQAFSTLTQSRLRARGVDVCVVNAAEAAYTFQNEAAEAARLVPALRPQRVLLELWANSPFDWKISGGRAYRFQLLQTAEDGFPDPFHLPLTLNRFLFGRSRLYELSAVALAPIGSNGAAWETMLTRVPALNALVEAHGGVLTLVLAPSLDQSFAATMIERRERPRYSQSLEYAPLLAWAASAGVEVLDLADVLQDSNVEDVRLDTCCHFNALGQERIADGLVAWRLGEPRP